MEPESRRIIAGGMIPLADLPFAPWSNFYVIVGSSAAALIGIQFVVIALIANTRRRASADTIDAFGTPTVVHLGGALVVSAVMSAPWHSLQAAPIAIAVCGTAGLVYVAIAMRRARRQTMYMPVWEDWLWHAVLPSSAHAALVLAALRVHAATHGALFVIAAATLGLLLIGIHNAWDSVTHLVVTLGDGDPPKVE